MRLPDVIQYLFPAAVLGVDVVIVDHGDGQGFRIGVWGLAAPEPSAEELAAAWDAVQAAEAAKAAAWEARLTMADEFHKLPVAIRERYLNDYTLINQALERGDKEVAHERLVNMTVYPGDEALHEMFLSLFPV